MDELCNSLEVHLAQIHPKIDLPHFIQLKLNPSLLKNVWQPYLETRLNFLIFWEQFKPKHNSEMGKMFIWRDLYILNPTWTYI